MSDDDDDNDDDDDDDDDEDDNADNDNDDDPVRFLWDSHTIPTYRHARGCVWDAYRSPTEIIWGSYGLPMGFQRIEANKSMMMMMTMKMMALTIKL